MLKTVAISAVAAVMGFTALFVGAASATGYFTRQADTVTTVEIPAEPVAGDCVIQTRWANEAGRMVQIERPVCY